MRKSVDVFERMGFLRLLDNWPAGSNQSMKYLPVYYVRDCGLLHAMLGIGTISNLRASEAVGHSWEGFAIEAIINAAPEGTTPARYFDDDQNEIDLVLNFSNGEIWAIEIKVNATKCATKGFAVACHEIGATRKIVIHSGESDLPLNAGVSRLTLVSAIQSLPR